MMEIDFERFHNQDYIEEGYDLSTRIPNISFIEPYMIQKLSPILNDSYNLHPGKDTTPRSKKEIERENILDGMYKKFFEKKK